MKKFIFLSFILLWTLSAQDSETNKLIEGLLGDTPIEEDLKELCDVIVDPPASSKAVSN